MILTKYHVEEAIKTYNRTYQDEYEWICYDFINRGNEEQTAFVIYSKPTNQYKYFIYIDGKIIKAHPTNESYCLSVPIYSDLKPAMLAVFNLMRDDVLRRAIVDGSFDGGLQRDDAVYCPILYDYLNGGMQQ